jgi:hypothetical protein
MTGAPRRRGWALTPLILLIVGGAPVAWAQHPVPAREKTLLERIAAAEAIALARVLRVEPGRLHLGGSRTLAGELPDTFQVKRAPLRPPPHQAGDLGVFFLRGARSPYVFAAGSGPILELEDDAAARRLAAAVEALIAAGRGHERLLALHLEWLQSSDETLRRLALVALLDPQPPLGPLPDGFGVARARIALDGQRPLLERRASARLAVADAGGLAELVSRTPGPAADAEIVATALLSGAARRVPGTGAAILRALGAADEEIRIAALRAAGLLRGGAAPELREAVSRLAEDEPNGSLRREAERTLRRLGEEPRPSRTES